MGCQAQVALLKSAGEDDAARGAGADAAVQGPVAEPQREHGQDACGAVPSERDPGVPASQMPIKPKEASQ